MPHQNRNREAIHRWVAPRIPEGGRVLDIGCGDGGTLARLVQERNVRGSGIEISEELVIRAVERGLSVHHGNVEEGLDHYSDGTFDVVILSLTIQEIGKPIQVINEALRAGKRAVIVFPNFGYWCVRWQLAVSGRSPRTASFPDAWHESPNRHFFTVADWESFCEENGWRCLDRGFIRGGSQVRLFPNWRAEVAMYLIEKA